MRLAQKKWPRKCAAILTPVIDAACTLAYDAERLRIVFVHINEGGLPPMKPLCRLLSRGELLLLGVDLCLAQQPAQLEKASKKPAGSAE
jgi:hypothetical protein